MDIYSYYCFRNFTRKLLHIIVNEAMVITKDEPVSKINFLSNVSGNKDILDALEDLRDCSFKNSFISVRIGSFLS
jgi:hypothetical protein